MDSRVKVYIEQQVNRDGAAFADALVAAEIRPDLFWSMEDAQKSFHDRESIRAIVSTMPDMTLFEICAVENDSRILVVTHRDLNITDPCIWAALAHGKSHQGEIRDRAAVN